MRNQAICFNDMRMITSKIYLFVCSFVHLFTLIVISGCGNELPDGCPPACSKINFRRASLTGVNLEGADLTGAILSGGQLNKANLKKANLAGANLTEANLVGADLSGAKLRGVNLTRANLSGANLDGADFSGADLTGAILTRLDLTNVNLNAIILNEAKLIGAKLWGSSLRGAQLVGADLRGSNLVGADLSGASFGDPSNALSGANLSGADMRGVRLIGADLTYANLTGADLSRAKMRDVIMFQTILAGATLTKADLRGANISDTDLAGAVLNGASLVKAKLNRVFLNGAYLYGTNLQQVRLVETASSQQDGEVAFLADLSGAHFADIGLLFRVGLEFINDLDLGNIPHGLQQGFMAHGVPPSQYAAVSIEAAGKNWKITDTLLFSVGSEFQGDLDNSSLTQQLRQAFENQGISISENVTVSIEEAGSRWLITDEDNQKTYAIRKDRGKLDIYIDTEHNPKYEIRKEGKQLNVYDLAAAGLVLTQTVPEEVLICEKIPLTFVVTNLGTGPMTNVKIIVSLPDGWGTMLTIAVTNVGHRPITNVKIHAPLPDSLVTIDDEKSVKFDVSTLLPGQSHYFEAFVKATTATADVGISSAINVEIKTPLSGVEPSVEFDVRRLGFIPQYHIRFNAALIDRLVMIDGKTSVKLDVSTLLPGQSRNFEAFVKAIRSGTFKNTATATADGGFASESTTTTTVREPVLVIAKTGPAKQFIKRNLTYNVKLSNTGDATAANTVLEDSILSSTTFISASDEGQYAEAEGKVLWQFGDLAPNAVKEVTVTVRADRLGRLRSAAQAKAVCTKPVSAVAVTEIVGIPAIRLEVGDDLDPIVLGVNVTYTITVTNQGTAVNTNIRIVCNLEDQMAYVSSTGTTKGTVQGQTITFAPLTRLEPKTKASWSIVARATGTGDVRFHVTMTTDELTRPVEETEATHFYE